MTSRFPDLFKPFSALRNRNFYLYWLAEFPYYFSIFSSNLAQGWLVYEMTKSSLLLGLMTAIAGIPQVIIALFGGALADRMEKKRLLLYVQVIMGVDALFLAFAMLFGAAEYWHVVVYAVIWRTAMTFGLPARLAFISEIVSQEEFMNAYSLYYVALNLLRIIGPALAGVLVKDLGVASVFLVLTTCQWVFNGLLYGIQPTDTATTPRNTQKKSSLRKSIGEVLVFAYHSPTILTLMGIKIALAFLAMPVINLMPAYAKEVLGVDAVGLGMLQAAGGVGSLIGSLLIMSKGKNKHKSTLLLGTCIARGMALLVFAISTDFHLSLITRLFIGTVSSAYVTLNSSLFQLSASDDIRGRIMSLYMVSFDFVGSIPLSLATEFLGIPLAFSLGGALLAIVSLAVLIALPSFRKLSM